MKYDGEIKPCPFCGGEARLKGHNKIRNAWFVQCHDCGMRTPLSKQLAYESWKTAMEYPVRLWNKRRELDIAVPFGPPSLAFVQRYTDGFETGLDVAISTILTIISRMKCCDVEHGGLIDKSELISLIRKYARRSNKERMFTGGRFDGGE